MNEDAASCRCDTRFTASLPRRYAEVPTYHDPRDPKALSTSGSLSPSTP